MRLHNLKIRNINSLQGNHTLDFTKTSINEVIAITGPTGSGKSSIFASISLALFGNHHKKDIAHKDLVTLGESDAAIELDFSIGEKLYQAKWLCRVRKKNGEALARPKIIHEFYHQGKHLEKSAQDIIGLNFDQFNKTVLLNQNEFNRFLNSSFAERKDILESLYSGHGVKEMGPALNRWLKDEKSKFEITAAKMESTMPFSAEEYETIKHQVKEYQKEIKTLSKDISETERELKLVQDYQKNLKYLEELQGKDKVFKTQIESKNDSFELLKSEKELLEKQLTEFNHHYQKEEKNLIRGMELETEIRSSKLHLVKIKNDFDENQRSIQAKKKNLTEKEKLLLDIQNKIDFLVKNAIFDIKNAQLDIEIKDYNLLISNKDKALIYLKRIKELESSIKTQEKELTDIVKKKKTFDDIDINSIEISKDKANIHLKELNSKLKNHSSSLEQLNVYDSNLKEHQKSLSNLDQQEEKTKKKLEELQRQINQDLIENQTEILTLLKDLNQNRDQCLLCESEIENNGDNESIKTDDKTLNDLTLKNDKLLSLKNENNKINIQSKHHQEESNKLNSLIEKILKNFSFQSIEEFQNEMTFIKENIQKAEQSLESIQAQLVQAQTKIKEKELLEEQIIKFKNSIKASQNDLQENINVHKQTDDEIKEIQARFKIINEEEFDIQQLETQRKDYRILEQDHRLLEQEVKQHQSDIKELEDKEAQLKIHLEKAEKNFNILKEEFNGFGFKNSPKVLFDQLKETQKNLMTQEKKVQHSFSQIEKEILTLKTQITENKKIKEILEKKIKEVNQDIKSIDLSEKEDLYKEQKKELERLISDSGKEEGRIKLYDERLKLLDELKDQAKQQKEHLDKLEALDKLIGREEFRNFVLAKVEKGLIQYANHELNSLCGGRYKIIHAGPKSKDFYIQDAFHEDHIRKVSTLSGGETFLMSLALAMALSEITRGKSIIDSFFIDEGFGTLDPEAIEEVSDILAGIGQRGKQLIIISHVENLTQRYQQTIRLHKNDHGKSKIEARLS